jgi:hypothetical protein
VSSYSNSLSIICLLIYCIPADESMMDETLCKGILNFTHMTISFSRFIYFTCLHTSFLVQRDHTFWADQMFFYTTGYILPLQFYNHTCTSNFMFHKSTPVLIFLRFTFIQIQVVFSSVLSQHNFSQVYHCANNTRPSHYHISHYTF